MHYVLLAILAFYCDCPVIAWTSLGVSVLWLCYIIGSVFYHFGKGVK